MFGLFFCLFVTPVLPVQSPRDVSADQTGNADAWQFTWGPLQWKQLCWKRSCTSVCVCFTRLFIKNSTAWPVAAFTHRNVNIASFFFFSSNAFFWIQAEECLQCPCRPGRSPWPSPRGGVYGAAYVQRQDWEWRDPTCTRLVVIRALAFDWQLFAFHNYQLSPNISVAGPLGKRRKRGPNLIRGRKER